MTVKIPPPLKRRPRFFDIKLRDLIVRREAYFISENKAAWMGFYLGLFLWLVQVLFLVPFMNVIHLGTLSLQNTLQNNLGRSFQSVSVLFSEIWFWLDGALILFLTTGVMGTLGLYLNQTIRFKDRELERMMDRSEIDPLTQLFNRRRILKELAKLYELYKISPETDRVGVLFLDIDHFKKINDLYGHGAGDEVLRQVSSLIENECRSYDFVGRWGGEEMIILSPKTYPERMVRFASRIRYKIEKLDIMVDQKYIPCTVSIGVSVSEDVHENPDLLIQRADELLYRAKENGRNRIAWREGNEILFTQEKPISAKDQIREVLERRNAL